MSTGIGLRDIADLEPPRLPALTPPSDQDLTAAEVTGRRIQQLGGGDAPALLGAGPSDGMPDTVEVTRPRPQPQQLLGQDPLNFRALGGPGVPTIAFNQNVPNAATGPWGVPDPQTGELVTPARIGFIGDDASTSIQPDFSDAFPGGFVNTPFRQEQLRLAQEQRQRQQFATTPAYAAKYESADTTGQNLANPDPLNFAGLSRDPRFQTALSDLAQRLGPKGRAVLDANSVIGNYQQGEGAAGGYYSAGSRQVVLDPNSYVKDAPYYAIGHELLHAYEDQFVTPQQRVEFQAKVYELARNGDEAAQEAIRAYKGDPQHMFTFFGERLIAGATVPDPLRPYYDGFIKPGKPANEPPPPPDLGIRSPGPAATRFEDQLAADGLPNLVTITKPTIRRGAAVANVVPQTAPTIAFPPTGKDEPLGLGALPGQQEQRLGLAGTITLAHPEVAPDPQRVRDIIAYILAQPDPQAALRSIVEPAFDPFTRGADFVNKYVTEPLAKFTDKTPIFGLAGGGLGGVGGYHGRTAEDNPATKFVYQSLPYVGADLLTGGTLTPAYLANAGLQVTAISDRYAAGEISGQDALEQAAANVAPFMLGPLLHGLGAGARGLTQFHDSPAGQAFVRRLQEERGSLGEKPFPGENPEQARFTPEGEVTSERLLQGDRGQQGDLLGAPAQTGEGLTTESAGPMFAGEKPMAQGIPESSLNDTTRAAKYLRGRSDGTIPDAASEAAAAEQRRTDAHARYEAVLNDPKITPAEKAPILTRLAAALEEPPPENPQEPAGVPPAPPSTEPPATEPAAPAAQPGPESAPVPEVGSGHLPKDTNDPYFEQAPPHWSEVPDRPSVALEQRRQQIEQELQANPMTPHTGAVRRVHRFREDTRAAAARGSKRRGQMVDQIAVSDSTYQKIKQAKDAAGLPFRGERNKQGGWWVDYEDELYGLDAQMETDHSPSIAQLKRAIELKAELKDVTHEIRAGAPDEQLTSADAAHMLRDQYHLLYHDVLNNAADEETAQMFGDVAQAYEDTMAAVNAGDRNMPASARRWLGLPERAKIDLNAGAATTPTRAASPATEYARDTAAERGIDAPTDQGGEAPEAARGAAAEAAPEPQAATALSAPSNAGAAQPALLTGGPVPSPGRGDGAPPAGPPRTPVRTGGDGGSGEVLPPVNTKFIKLMQQAVITPTERARLLAEGRSRQAGGIVSAAKGEGSFAERQAQASARASGQILPDFQAIGEKFTPDELAQLHGQIDQALADKRITSFQWKTAGDVFQRIMLGGKEPQPAERKLLAQIFGPEFEQAIPHGPEQWKLWHEVIGALGVPQAFSTSFDLSAPLRQGAVLGASHPFIWGGTFRSMVRAASSGEAAEAIDTAIRERNPWVKGTGELDGYGFEDVGGHLSSLDRATEAGQREGQFASLNKSFISRMVQKFPGIRQSERGFVTMLNKLRADVYASEAARMWQTGERDVAQYSALAKTINHATGWGDFKVGQITDGINAFFSPRNLTARFQVVIDPLVQPGSLLKPSARQLAAKNLVMFAGYNAAVLGLVKFTGMADVELDPRSTDWGKMRIGNTRIDLMAGYGPMVRLVARLSPEKIGGGVTKTATGNFTAIDRKQLAIDFLRGKLGPVPSVVTDAFLGKNMVGQKTDLTTGKGIRTQIYNSFVPFIVQDVNEALKEQGIGAAAVAAPAAFFGAGVMSYGNPSRDLLEARDAAAKADGYADFADASGKLGANAAAAKYAANADVQKAQAKLDENPSPFKAVQQNFAADQEQADAQLAVDHNVGAWRDARTKIQQGQASQLALLKQQNGGKLPDESDPVLAGYYAVFDQYANAKTGVVLDKQGLSQALDEYTAKLSPEDQARIDANTGLKGTPTEQSYRAAVKKLADAKFFDQEKQAYTSKKYSTLLAAARTPLAPNGLMPEKFSSLSAMKANYVAAYVKKHPQVDALAAAADGGREFERIGAVKQLRNGLQDYRLAFYKSNPELLQLATQWGFNTLSKAEEKLLPTPVGAR